MPFSGASWRCRQPGFLPSAVSGLQPNGTRADGAAKFATAITRTLPPRHDPPGQDQSAAKYSTAVTPARLLVESRPP